MEAASGRSRTVTATKEMERCFTNRDVCAWMYALLGHPLIVACDGVDALEHLHDQGGPHFALRGTQVKDDKQQRRDDA
jgi:hypothetical protein